MRRPFSFLCPKRVANKISIGDIQKNSGIRGNRRVSVSANANAGCTNTQFAGAWDVAFSDGNSCRLVVDQEGDVLIEPDSSQSTCFDPFRGVTVFCRKRLLQHGSREVADRNLAQGLCSRAFDCYAESDE